MVGTYTAGMRAEENNLKFFFMNKRMLDSLNYNCKNKN
jgi:hypothetical protein